MTFVTVRHFTEDDIPLRLQLLRESQFQANLSDFAVQAADADLVADVRRTIAERQAERRIFTLCGAGDAVMGFAWITSVDWRNQCCELSFGVLPRYRGGPGALGRDVLLGQRPVARRAPPAHRVGGERAPHLPAGGQRGG